MLALEKSINICLGLLKKEYEQQTPETTVTKQTKAKFQTCANLKRLYIPKGLYLCNIIVVCCFRK